MSLAGTPTSASTLPYMYSLQHRQASSSDPGRTTLPNTSSFLNACTGQHNCRSNGSCQKLHLRMSGVPDYATLQSACLVKRRHLCKAGLPLSTAAGPSGAPAAAPLRSSRRLRVALAVCWQCCCCLIPLLRWTVGLHVAAWNMRAAVQAWIWLQVASFGDACASSVCPASSALTSWTAIERVQQGARSVAARAAPHVPAPCTPACVLAIPLSVLPGWSTCQAIMSTDRFVCP